MRRLGLQNIYGNLNVVSPAGTSALTLAGANNNYTAGIIAPNTAGQSYGILLQAGSNTSDFALNIVNAANSSALFRVFGDGSVTVGAPTGGAQGLGTINATGLFINGVSVGGSSGITKSVLTSPISTSSNTTLANTGLSVALTAGKYYSIFIFLPVQDAGGASGGGIKTALAYSGTGGLFGYGGFFDPAGAGSHANMSEAMWSAANTVVTISPALLNATGSMVQYNGVAYGGSVGGNLTVQWAQNSSNANSITMQAGASILAIQLN